MNIVSREEACCIFFCKKFNEENVKICTERVEEMVEVEICYRSNPTEPELVSEARIFGAPSLFNMYKSKEEIEKNGEEIEKNKDGKGDILFCNDAQIVDFINYVFRPHVEFSPDSSYKLDYVYDKEILGVVWVSTKKFDKTTALAFSKWLNKQNIDFLLEEPERKLVKGSKITDDFYPDL